MDEQNAGFIFGGFLLAAIGMVMVAAGGDSGLMAFLGWLAIGAGGLIAQIGVIAIGVAMGMKSASAAAKPKKSVSTPGV